MKEYAVGKIIGIVPRTTQESPRTAQDGPRTCDDPGETRFPFGPVGPIGDPGVPGPCGRSGWQGPRKSLEPALELDWRRLEAAKRIVRISYELQLTPNDMKFVYDLIEKHTVPVWKD